MVIHWLIPGNYKSVTDLHQSNVANVRMRAGLVAKFASDIQIEFSAGDYVNKKADIIVIGKIGADCQHGREDLWINQLSEVKNNYKKIILDYTDHHLGSTSSPMNMFYKKALPLTHKTVVSSTRMSRLFSQFAAEDTTVIEDPIEVKSINPNIAVIEGDMTLLWFGHATNIPFLVNYLINDFLCDLDFRLIVLSNIAGLEYLKVHKKNIRSTIKMELSEWSLQNMIDSAKISHGCLIPSDLNEPRKSGASSNRLITAFALGLPVSADLLESYAPFSEYFHNIREAPLSTFNKKLALYSKCLSLAQETIVPIFSEESMARKWKSLFLTVK
jgi:hypothetical protein